mmetsp:Transcript_131064/g.261490  ORF Transcript_131064/g.261490 Transcript_131064/m.261490 type:complete len:238 (+) Transcript_131064:493-1206(+)
MMTVAPCIDGDASSDVGSAVGVSSHGGDMSSATTAATGASAVAGSALLAGASTGTESFPSVAGDVSSAIGTVVPNASNVAEDNFSITSSAAVAPFAVAGASSTDGSAMTSPSSVGGSSAMGASNAAGLKVARAPPAMGSVASDFSVAADGSSITGSAADASSVARNTSAVKSSVADLSSAAATTAASTRSRCLSRGPGRFDRFAPEVPAHGVVCSQCPDCGNLSASCPRSNAKLHCC